MSLFIETRVRDGVGTEAKFIGASTTEEWELLKKVIRAGYDMRMGLLPPQESEAIKSLIKDLK